MKETLFISIYDVSEIFGCVEVLDAGVGHPAKDDDFTNAVFGAVVRKRFTGHVFLASKHAAMPVPGNNF